MKSLTNRKAFSRQEESNLALAGFFFEFNIAALSVAEELGSLAMGHASSAVSRTQAQPITSAITLKYGFQIRERRPLTNITISGHKELPRVSRPHSFTSKATTWVHRPSR